MRFMYLYAPVSLGWNRAIRTFLADFRQTSGGVVPILRQGQHHGEQPFGFQRQPRVAQVVVGHHGVVAGFLNAKYCHHITSFRCFEKVFVFREKTVSTSPGCPGGENLWAVTFWLVVGGETLDFRLLSAQFENCVGAPFIGAPKQEVCEELYQGTKNP